MNRQFQPELLDELPSTDPRAIHSRRDLRRINAIMRNAHYLKNLIVGIDVRRFTSKKITLLEIGAGDGNIAFQLARALSRQGTSGSLLLLDRQPVINEPTHIPNWTHEVIEADLFDWLPSAPPIDIAIANLFLHHFTDLQLQTLFSALSKITHVFAACEPRRNKFAPFIARNVWLVGCNQVTCHDAEISVRAGFRDHELSALWTAQSRSFRPSPHVVPLSGGPPLPLSAEPPWRLTEHRAGLFTHFFAAVRAQ